jgi:hypothetical protein
LVSLSGRSIHEEKHTIILLITSIAGKKKGYVYWYKLIKRPSYHVPIEYTAATDFAYFSFIL